MSRPTSPMRLRIDCMRVYSPEEMSAVLGDVESGFLCQEQGELSGKIHLQGVIWTTYTPEAIRNRIKKYLGPFENATQYSVSTSFNVVEAGSERNVQRYCQYCCKGFTARGLGDHKVFWSKTCTEAELNEYNRLYWELNNEIKATNKSYKQMKANFLTLLKNDLPDELLSSGKLAKYIIEVCSKHECKIPNPTKIQEYVLTLLLYQADKNLEFCLDMQPTVSEEAVAEARAYRYLIIQDIASLGTPHFSKNQVEVQDMVRTSTEKLIKKCYD